MIRVRCCHAWEAPREDQLLDETRFACFLTTRLKVDGRVLVAKVKVWSGRVDQWKERESLMKRSKGEKMSALSSSVETL